MTGSQAGMARRTLTDPDLERAVLGSLLASRGGDLESIDALSSNDFTVEAHRECFESMQRLAYSEGGFDLPLVAHEVPAIVDVVADGPITSFHAPTYVCRLKELTARRHACSFALQLNQMAGDPDVPVEDSLLFADTGLKRLRDEQSTPGWLLDSDDKVEPALALLRRIQTGERGVPTGYRALDELVHRGFQAGDLVVLAGRPSMGKSTLGMNIGWNVAGNGRGPVLVFSLEVGRGQFFLNLAMSTAQIDLPAGELGREDFDALEKTLDTTLRQTPIQVDEQSRLTISSMYSAASRFKRKYGLGLVIVDHLGLMSAEHRHTSRVHEVSEISRGLKEVARRLEVPVLAMCQLSRAPEMREQHMPRLSDLRDSGSIEQDADIVLLLYREDYYKPNDAAVEGRARVKVAKHRNGPTGSLNLRFNKRVLRFEEP